MAMTEITVTTSLATKLINMWGIEMRRILAALAITLIMAGSVAAAEKTFTGAWDWFGDEADIQGFRIKNQDNEIVVDTDQIPPSSREATGNITVAEGGCVTLFVVAVETNGDESGNSNILNYCLPKPKTVTVQQFSFTIE
jgi:hypothetical protein